MSLAAHELGQAFAEVLIARDARDAAAAGDAVPPPEITPQRLMRIGFALTSNGRSLLSIPTAAAHLGVDGQLLFSLVRAGQLEHYYDVGLYFVDPQRLPIASRIEAKGAVVATRRWHRARRLNRNVRCERSAMLRLAAALLAERAAARITNQLNHCSRCTEADPMQRAPSIVGHDNPRQTLAERPGATSDHEDTEPTHQQAEADQGASATTASEEAQARAIAGVEVA